MVWYTGEDKKIYDSGIHFRPQQKYLTTDYEWPTEGDGGGEGGGGGGVSYGIPAASGGGGTYYSPDKTMANFNTAIADRQKRLENPSWIQEQINKFTGGGQRPVSEMGRVQYNPKFTRSYIPGKAGNVYDYDDLNDYIAAQTGTTSFGLPYPTINRDLKQISNAATGEFGQMPVVPTLDERRSKNMPLGIGKLFSTMMPDAYYDKFTVPEQALTQMYMGYTDPNTGMGNKDPFGINVRSGFGNYAEYSGKRVDKLNDALAKSAAKRGLTWDAETGSIVGVDEDDPAYQDFMNMTKNMQSQLGHYGQVTQDFNFLKSNYDVAKKQRAAWEKETGRELDFADQQFKETGDYDEYAGAGGTPNFTIHDPSTTAKGYTYEGSDEQDKDNEYSGGSNMGATQHGSSGMTKDQHDAFRAATGGRVYLNLGGIASVLGTEQDRREGLRYGGLLDIL